MTREYFGIFSLTELVLAIISIGLTVAAITWVFMSENQDRNWQWLMFGALILTVVGQQLRRRRIARDYGDDTRR